MGKKLGLTYVDIINRLCCGDKFVEQLYNIQYVPAAPSIKHIVLSEGEFVMEGNTINLTPSSIEFDRIVKIPDTERYCYGMGRQKTIEPGTTVIVHTQLLPENIIFKYKNFAKAQYEFEKIYFTPSNRGLKKKDVCDEKVNIKSDSYDIYFMNLMSIRLDSKKQEVEFVVDWYVENI